MLSLVLGLYYHEHDPEKAPFLVIVSKTLLSNWVGEIKKFFSEFSELRYEILHQEYNHLEHLPFSEKVQFYITTPDVCSKYYTVNHIDEKFKYYIEEMVGNLPVQKLHYHRPTTPFYETKRGANMIFSLRWSALFIDEIHQYTNILSNRCQAFASICSPHRWGLSGYSRHFFSRHSLILTFFYRTFFDEPKAEKILGFYMIVDKSNYPRSLPASILHLASSAFQGYIFLVSFPLKTYKC